MKKEEKLEITRDLIQFFVDAQKKLQRSFSKKKEEKLKKKCFGSKNTKFCEGKRKKKKDRKSPNEIKKVVTNHKSEGKSFLLLVALSRKRSVQLFNKRFSCNCCSGESVPKHQKIEIQTRLRDLVSLLSFPRDFAVPQNLELFLIGSG